MGKEFVIKLNWAQLLLITGLFSCLSACSTVSTTSNNLPQLIGIQGAAVVGTGKTVTDHIVSFATGKDCSTIRKNTGRHYCEEDEVAVPDKVFCYTTLGDVTCYERPAPYGETKRKVGKIPPGAGPPR